MKKIVQLSIVLFISSISAQSFIEAYENTRHREPFDQRNGLYNDQFNSLNGNEFEWSKVVGVGYDFDNIRLAALGLNGSAYLFKNWDNKAVVEVDKKRYLFTNMNYHIYNDQFLSKLDNDSIFVLNSSTVDKIKVNNRSFRGVYDSKTGSTRMYEIVFEHADFSILKSYRLGFIDSSPNPMVNRPKPKIKKNSSYFTYRNKTLMPLKLKKAAILDFVGDKASKIQTFAKQNQLSFKKEADLAKILNYGMLN